MSRFAPFLLSLLAGAAHAEHHAFVGAGFGFPTLAHAEASWHPLPRLSVDVRYDWTVFNHLVGLGATGYLLGEAEDRPPRHALLVAGQLMVNPAQDEFSLKGDGAETIGAAAGLSVGYGFLTDIGFHLRVRLGAFAYEDNGFAMGGHLRTAVGWFF